MLKHNLETGLTLPSKLNSLFLHIQKHLSCKIYKLSPHIFKINCCDYLNFEMYMHHDHHNWFKNWEEGPKKPAIRFKCKQN